MFLIGEGDKTFPQYITWSLCWKKLMGKLNIDGWEKEGKNASEPHRVVESKDSASFLMFSLSQNSGQMCAMQTGA